MRVVKAAAVQMSPVLYSREGTVHSSPQFNGLLLVVGFVALLILLVLSH